MGQKVSETIEAVMARRCVRAWNKGVHRARSTRATLERLIELRGGRKVRAYVVCETHRIRPELEALCVILLRDVCTGPTELEYIAEMQVSESDRFRNTWTAPTLGRFLRLDTDRQREIRTLALETFGVSP